MILLTSVVLVNLPANMQLARGRFVVGYKCSVGTFRPILQSDLFDVVLVQVLGVDFFALD